MDASVMFVDCPAYMDQTGSVRCGLPAEVQGRHIMRSTDGPLESARIPGRPKAGRGQRDLEHADDDAVNLHATLSAALAAGPPV